MNTKARIFLWLVTPFLLVVVLFLLLAILFAYLSIPLIFFVRYLGKKFLTTEERNSLDSAIITKAVNKLVESLDL